MVTKSTAALNAACNAVVDLVDQGSTYSTGFLNIYSSDSTVMVHMPLSNPAFAPASDGTALANTITSAVCLADGTASYFRFVDRDGTYVYGGSVTGNSGSGDMKLTSVSIPSGAVIFLSSAIYVVP